MQLGIGPAPDLWKRQRWGQGPVGSETAERRFLFTTTELLVEFHDDRGVGLAAATGPMPKFSSIGQLHRRRRNSGGFRANGTQAMDGPGSCALRKVCPFTKGLQMQAPSLNCPIDVNAFVIADRSGVGSEAVQNAPAPG